MVEYGLSVPVIIFKKSAQLILCGVHDPISNTSFSVAIIYAFNTEMQRRHLWEELSSLIERLLSEQDLGY